jgi:hypothetical protein
MSPIPKVWGRNVLRKCFSFNEFGPSLLQGASVFLGNSACLYGRVTDGHRCFLDRAIPGGSVGPSPISKRPRLAVSARNGRRIAAADRLHVSHRRPASTGWRFIAFRLRWKPSDQHGLTTVTLLGEEPGK